MKNYRQPMLLREGESIFPRDEVPDRLFNPKSALNTLYMSNNKWIQWVTYL